MAGLEHLTGGGPADKPKPIYDLAVASLAAAAPASKSQLTIPMPTSVIALQTQRMLYALARWTDFPCG